MPPAPRLVPLAGALLALAAPGAGRASPRPARDATARQVLRVQLLSPSLSADGRTVAMVSLDPGGVKGASGALVLFDTSGKVKRRIPLFTPARDAARAASSYREADRLLEQGGFRRMAPLHRLAERARRRAGGPPQLETVLSQGSHGITLEVTDGQVRIKAVRGRRTLGTWALPLRVPGGACSPVGAYAVPDARAGFATRPHLVAFSVVVEGRDGEPCFSHEFVLPLQAGRRH